MLRAMTRRDSSDDETLHVEKAERRGPLDTSPVSSEGETVAVMSASTPSGRHDLVLSGPQVSAQLDDASRFDSRYAKRRTLGVGGMGVVQLHHDQWVGREVAVKVMRPDIAEDPSARARFLREARIQAQLEHPSVVPVYDLGVGEAGQPLFTMKRVKGLTLEEIIDGHRLGDAALLGSYSRRQLLSALARVCLAVSFAHDRGVVHRDLKPANIMLGDYGEVNVLDWGVAKVRGSSDEPLSIDTGEGALAGTQAGAILGTPGFMAPEQARGEISAVSAQSDIYALGCILFELLTLAPLHRGETVQALLLSVVTGHQERPSERAPEGGIAPELDQIVLTATELEPQARFSSARAMHDAIERYLDGERDLEQRRERAQRHTLNAQLALAHAMSGAGEAERARGMRELSLALALDPSHEGAMATLMRVLLDPSTELPPEAEAELMEVNRLDRVQAGRAIAIGYAVWFLVFPLMLLMEVRSWPLLLTTGGLLTVQLTTMVWMSVTGNATPRYVRWTFPTTFLAVASLGAMFGPLFVVPGVAAVNAAVMMVSLRANRITRRGIMIGSIAAIALPFVLQLTGALPASYSFEGGLMRIHPVMLELPPTYTLLLLGVMSVLTVMTGNTLVGRGVHALTAAERRIFAHAWRLRQLVPQSARPKS